MSCITKSFFSSLLLSTKIGKRNSYFFICFATFQKTRVFFWSRLYLPLDTQWAKNEKKMISKIFWNIFLHFPKISWGGSKLKNISLKTKPWLYSKKIWLILPTVPTDLKENVNKLEYSNWITFNLGLYPKAVVKLKGLLKGNSTSKSLFL